MNTVFLNHLRKKYLELDDYNERNVQIKIVKPFLEELGYLENWQQFEYPVIKNKSITDITIIKNKKIILIVEVKKGGNYWIKKEDLQQLLTYLHTKNVEWGIVTNGKEYVLVNSKINGELQDKVVFKFNVLEATNESMIKYLSFESLIETQFTYYLKHLAQFKCYMLQDRANNSWSAYNPTIVNYFDFLQIKYTTYRKLEYLSKEDFKEFVLYDINKSRERKKDIKATVTIINKYRHISKFYELLVKHEELNHNHNPFRYMTEEEMILGIDGLKLSGDHYLEELSLEDLALTIDKYDDSQDTERNKLIFLLCFYLGLDRDDIRLLKINDFNFEDYTININEVIFPLPYKFAKRIKDYIENVRDKEARVDYIFDSNYGKFSGQPLSKGSINGIINRNSAYANRLLGDNKEINFTPENIRKLIIKKFYDVGFSIEEIVTITRVPLHIISEYISIDEIIERTKIESLPNKHPYIDLFQKYE